MPRTLTEQVFEGLAPERARLASVDAEILDTQIAISRIAAPTGQEAERGAWVARRFASFGLAARIDEVGNVIARVPGTGRTPVVVAAHLDTVFPMETPLEFVRTDRRVTGPGICDNGRGLAAMLAVADALAQSPTPPAASPVEFVATVGEEGTGNLRGVRHFLATNPTPLAFVGLDNAGDSKVINQAIGSSRFRITYRGPGGHSWASQGVPNPVHAAARAAATLATLRLARGPRSTLHVTRIGGGLSINSIPQEAWLEVDARSTNAAALARLEADIREAVRAAATAENDQVGGKATLTFSLDALGARPAGETPSESPLVAIALQATRLVGRTPELAAASTDANAAIALGVPALTIGGGGTGGDTHTPQEWFDATDSGAGVSRALTIVAAARCASLAQ